MPNVTMSTSDGANANRSVNLVMPGNNILPFKHDLTFNPNANRYGEVTSTEPPKNVLANIEQCQEEENPSSVSSSTINSERPILTEKLTLGSNVGFVGKIMMEPISLTEGINSLKSMNSVNSLNTIKSDGTGIVGLKPLDNTLKPTILRPISLKLEKTIENDDENECKSGFEDEIEQSPDQTRDIIRTISTISALPTRLLPTGAGIMSSLNEVDLMINNATTAGVTTVVTGDSGMDTISTNSSDIV